MLNIIRTKSFQNVHKKSSKSKKINKYIGSIRQLNNSKRIIRRSEIFAPIHWEEPSDAVIVSHKLLTQAGFIRKLASGIYNYLPLAERTLNKISGIIDDEMISIGGQKLTMPKLLPKDLWTKTGRWNIMGDELIRLRDRKNEEFCLAPTHEEIITNIVANDVSSYRSLPLRLYQIGVKFRDEIRPRFGIIRGREFLMKDMYSFDKDQESANKTYNEVMEAYHIIMKRIGIPYVVAEADSGNIGGNKSHEFHALADIGEDTIVYCDTCNFSSNIEKVLDAETIKLGNFEAHLSSCGSHVNGVKCNGNLKVKKGIEIGHCFYLGTKYSSVLNATITNNDITYPIEMGCYGIGVSRIMAAIIETSYDSNGIIWPESIAPYQTIIICNENMNDKAIEFLLDVQDKIPSLKDEFVFDDRKDFNFGYKLKESSLIGFPYKVIFGKSMISEGKIEIERRSDGKKYFLTTDEAINFFKKCNPKLVQ